MRKILLLVIMCNNLNGMGTLSNNLFGLKILLSLGLLHPDRFNNDGTTPLHRAVATQDPRRLQLLIDHSSHVDMRDRRSGWTPLHYASLKGNDIFIALLARAGASVNDVTNQKTQNRPLHITTHLHHLGATQALLDAGADAHATNIHQQTPLHELCISEQPTELSHKLTIARLLVGHATQNGKNRDSFVLARDTYGKTAADYVGDQDEELKEFLLPALEYNRRQFYAMLEKRGLTVAQFLRSRELGLIH